MEDFPMPNVNQFVDVALPPPASRRRSDGHDTGTVLPRNQLDYQYAEHHKPPIAPYVDRSDSASTPLGDFRRSHDAASM